MTTAAPSSPSNPAPNFPNPPTCSLWGPVKADPDIAGTGVRTMVMIRCILSTKHRFTGSHQLYALCLSHSIPRHRTLPVRRPCYNKSNWPEIHRLCHSPSMEQQQGSIKEMDQGPWKRRASIQWYSGGHRHGNPPYRVYSASLRDLVLPLASYCRSRLVLDPKPFGNTYCIAWLLPQAN